MEVIDFKKAKEEKEKMGAKPQPCKFEFHLHRTLLGEEDTSATSDELVTADGFLKFGPQFVAVVSNNDDANSEIIFAVATNLIKYVKRLGTEGEVLGTLSPVG